MPGVTTYRVRAQRDGDWWEVSVPGVERSGAQVHVRTGIEAAGREAIAFALSIEPDSFALEVFIQPERSPAT